MTEILFAPPVFSPIRFSFSISGRRGYTRYTIVWGMYKDHRPLYLRTFMMVKVWDHLSKWHNFTEMFLLLFALFLFQAVLIVCRVVFVFFVCFEWNTFLKLSTLCNYNVKTRLVIFTGKSFNFVNNWKRVIIKNTSKDNMLSVQVRCRNRGDEKLHIRPMA